ncbi:MEL2A protein, partial [Polypterus senegalus]
MAAPAAGDADEGKRRPQFGSRLLVDPSHVFRHNACNTRVGILQMERSRNPWRQEAHIQLGFGISHLSTEQLPNQDLMSGVDHGGAPQMVQTPYELQANSPDGGTSLLSIVFSPRDSVEWTEEQEAAALRKVQENSQPLTADKQEEYESRARDYWDDFYKIHENRFFKDRHWLFTEFPELNRTCGAGGVQDGAADAQFPGCCATYRVLECGTAGSALGQSAIHGVHSPRSVVSPRAWHQSPLFLPCSDPGLFVYACDFSSTAVELLKAHPDYDASRCHAFVHDLCEETSSFPVPKQSVDVVILIFVLSALRPDKMAAALSRLARLLRPGGLILLRDYGRYDMAQLRFKKDELDGLLTQAGLTRVQNVVDRRLQVNRGKQLKMYRVWIQCKYQKPPGTAPPVASRQ